MKFLDKILGDIDWFLSIVDSFAKKVDSLLSFWTYLHSTVLGIILCFIAHHFGWVDGWGVNHISILFLLKAISSLIKRTNLDIILGIAIAFLWNDIIDRFIFHNYTFNYIDGLIIVLYFTKYGKRIFDILKHPFLKNG